MFQFDLPVELIDSQREDQQELRNINLINDWHTLTDIKVFEGHKKLH